MDASAYDYLVIKFSNVTGDNIDIFLEVYDGISKTPENEDLFTQSIRYAINNETTEIAIDLQESSIAAYTNRLKQVIAQSKTADASSCTITSMTLMTEDEYNGIYYSAFGLGESDINKWNADYSSKTVTYTADWAGCGWWLGSADYTDFDRVVVEFDQAIATDAELVVQYDYKDDSDKYYTSNQYVSAGARYVTVDLNEAYKDKINQIYLTNRLNTTATYTFKRAYAANTRYAILDESVGYVYSTSHAKVELNRTFYSGYNSLCLPFATTVEALGATKAYEFTSYASNTITMTAVTELVAGTPYIVQFAADKTTPTVFADVDITATTPLTVEHDGASFVGNFTANKSAADLYGVNGSGNIQKGGSTAIINAFGAYFTGVSAATSRAINFGDEDATAIESLSPIAAPADGIYYDLQGRRVANPTKGLYIVNGKKIMFK